MKNLNILIYPTNPYNMLFNEEIMKEMIVARPRPTFSKEMYNELAVHAAAYLNVSKTDEDYSDCLESISKILEQNKYSTDGYELGKEFDDAGFEMNAQIVSDLDCLSSDKESILNKVIEDWVISDNIQPKFDVGAKIIFKLCFKENEGEIVEVNTKRAYYIVKTAEYKGNGGYVVKYEEIC